MRMARQTGVFYRDGGTVLLRYFLHDGQSQAGAVDIGA